jgi:hypothetical protein
MNVTSGDYVHRARPASLVARRIYNTLPVAPDPARQRIPAMMTLGELRLQAASLDERVD